MKVGFNISPLSSGHQTRGIGFYTRNLLSELIKVQGLEVQEFQSLSDLGSVDLIHYPFFDLFQRTLPKRKMPTVVTVLDVTPLIFPKAYPPGIKGTVKHWFQKRALQDVDGVITISEQSKKDIAKYLGYPQEKIFVTYLAAEDRFKVIKDKNALKEVSNKYKLPEKFSLYVGNVNWNKNILNLTKASLEAGLDVVMVGKSFEQTDHLDHPELRDFKQFINLYRNHHQVHILGFVSDEDIVKVTNLASLMLFPSRYEGFGIPVLEAQQCGVPVITSNTSSLPEVAGDGALLINPDDISEMTNAIRRLMEDKELRKDLIKKGFENTKSYSWQKCAQETFEVYKRILNDSLASSAYKECS